MTSSESLANVSELVMSLSLVPSRTERSGDGDDDVYDIDDGRGSWACIDIRAEDMRIDRTYQPIERFDPVRVAAIAATWHWGLYDPIKVALYIIDGEEIPHVINGQHRLAGAIIRYGPRILLPCYVGAVEQKEAARIFADADLNRRKLSEAIKINAEVIADDPHAINLVGILARYGWTLALNGKTTSTKMACASALKRIYRDSRGGPERLDRTIRVATAAWGHTTHTANHAFLGGIARFLRDYGDDADDRILVGALARKTYAELILVDASKIAARLCVKTGGANYEPVSLAILDAYNHGRGARRIAPRAA